MDAGEGKREGQTCKLGKKGGGKGVAGACRVIVRCKGNGMFKTEGIQSGARDTEEKKLLNAMLVVKQNS